MITDRRPKLQVKFCHHGHCIEFWLLWFFGSKEYIKRNGVADSVQFSLFIGRSNCHWLKKSSIIKMILNELSEPKGPEKI